MKKDKKQLLFWKIMKHYWMERRKSSPSVFVNLILVDKNNEMKELGLEDFSEKEDGEEEPSIEPKKSAKKGKEVKKSQL